MSRFIDLTGKRFGRLIVLSPYGKTKHNCFIWMCKCDCGNYKPITSRCLITGSSLSCGCLSREIHNKIAKKLFTRHGLNNTKLNAVWKGMKKRCFNENSTEYINYGGRGITMCPEWSNDFETFYMWAISNGYQEGLSIDRIDNNGNYEPSNCRWITRQEQAYNRRSNKLLLYNGEYLPMKLIAKMENVDYDKFRYYITKNFSVEEAINKIKKQGEI